MIVVTVAVTAVVVLDCGAATVWLSMRNTRKSEDPNITVFRLHNIGTVHVNTEK